MKKFQKEFRKEGMRILIELNENPYKQKHEKYKVLFFTKFNTLPFPEYFENFEGFLKRYKDEIKKINEEELEMIRVKLFLKEEGFKEV